jgi:hypothetical protein
MNCRHFLLLPSDENSPQKKNVGPEGHQNIARFSKFSTFLSDLQPNLANSSYCG